ncbi:MAG: N-acetylglucosamine-6-phosphate deacetylase [Bacteroidales bacterium]
MTEYTVVKGIHYETGKAVKIEIRDGFISNISDVMRSNQEPELFVAPGFIDNQINGYRGVDFSGPELTTYDMRTAVDAIRKDGVTTFQPTIITNSHENLLKIFRNLVLTLKDKDISDSVPGFHLEGPYISPQEGYYGCHPAGFIRKPSWKEFSEYQEAAEGKIRQVTIAPEVEGAIEFIRLCARENILVAIGHTNASAFQITQATDNGASLSTHLGNGCANMIHRHMNPLWAQMANDNLTPSIIADGHHLLPEEIQVFYKIKGPHNIILTSDVTHLIGMTPGKYMFLGSEIVYTDDGLIKNPVLNVLAGASFPIRRGVENMMNFTGCSLDEAVNLATRNVSRACRLPGIGSLEPGKRADLILFEMAEGKIIIKQTWVNGEIVFSQL